MQQVERKRTKLTSRQQHQRTAGSGADATLSGEQLSHEPLQTSATSSSTFFSDKTPRKSNLGGGESHRVWTAGSCRSCWEWLAPPTPVHGQLGWPITALLVDISPPEEPRVCLSWEKLERLELPEFPQLQASREQRLIHMLMSWHGEAARAPDRDNTSLFPGSGMIQSRHRVVVGGALAVGERLGGFFAIPSLSQ